MKGQPSSTPAPGASSVSIDAYIDRAKTFAIPILLHLRRLIHKACPQVEESIKWSRPFFLYRGTILCNLSAFTHHCSLGFWGQEIAAVLHEADALKPGAMGSLGRITSLADLPPDKLLLAWLKQAAALIDSGDHTSPMKARHQVVKAPQPTPSAPQDLLDALSGDPKASTAYTALSPSCKREYLEWITSAKRAETRSTRIATTLAWLAEGKQRN